MLDPIERRTGKLPKVLLADAKHASHDCVRTREARGVEVLIAVPARSNKPMTTRADGDAPSTRWGC